MIRKGLFLHDGPSDAPLSKHLENLCQGHGCDIRLTVLDGALLAVGHTVARRLLRAFDLDPDFEIVFVHRDAEHQDPQARFDEVNTAIRTVDFTGPHVAVVPVRMTEAWLLLDEASIRSVAGNPAGKVPLGLPVAKEVEGLPDPKAVLRDMLVIAGEVQGKRRLKRFKDRFPEHRRQLLDRLDATRLGSLSAWQRLESDVQEAVQILG